MIVYIVQPGDTLNMLAGKFHVSVQEIVEHNWVGTDMLIVPGQILFIPRDDKCHHLQSDDKVSDALSLLYPYIKQKVFYVVQRGDTLATIARRFDTTIDAIVEASDLAGTGELIFPGLILRIPIIGFR